MAARILVVGGAGYIGSTCALHLEEAGHEIVVLDDLSTGHRGAVSGTFVQADVRDRDTVRRVLKEERIDGVMHFAANSLVGESMTRPLKYYDNNVAGTLALLAAMQDTGVRSLVFSSTCAIYGNPERLPLDETHPKAPVNHYGVSKLMIEQVLDASRELEGLRCTALRYFNAAGARPDGALGESHAHETHLIPLAIAAALGARPPLQLYGEDYETRDGTCIRDYIHVLDLAEVHGRAMERLLAGDPGAAYNVGTGHGTTVREVLDSVGRALGIPVPVESAPRRAGDPPALYACADKVHRELDWTPKWTEIDDIVGTAAKWAQTPRF